MLLNIPKNISSIEKIIRPTLERDISELGTTEKAILYLGTYELKFQPEVPYRVVINEAVELAKLYGAEGSYKLVNSSLDKIAPELRSLEFA